MEKIVSLCAETAPGKIVPHALTRSGGMIWPTAMEELLRALVAERNSGGTIATAINAKFGLELSRNAIMGKANRMGLKLLSQPRRTTARPERTWNSAAQARLSRLPAVKAEIVVPKIRDTDIPQEQLRTILTIEKGQCLFYVERPGPDQLFCGGPIQEDSSYCSHHHQVAHVVR
jgi:GcrA cell cycle regulator